MPRIVACLFLLVACAGLRAATAERMLTYNTLPLGTPEAPLVLRTYFPDIDLDPSALSHHHHGDKSPKYDPAKGTDVPGEYEPVKGIPAAIGVNHGPALSYIFDTTECRVLYAWQGGFVDMFPYWGDQQLGTRQASSYVPPLVGTVFYKTRGAHPVEFNGKSVSELGAPKFVGYDLVNKQPVFIAKFGNQTIRTKIQPLPKELGMKLEITAEPSGELSFHLEDPGLNVKQQSTNGVLTVTVVGQPIASFSGFSRKTNFTEASVEAGDMLSKNYGCVVCHSADGAAGHGPTWAGLYEKMRPLADGTKVKADEAYLYESIKTPNAKIAATFAPNFMPPYPMLKQIELDSLVMYIKSLKNASTQPE